MTRIGFAYNQKPRSADSRVEDDADSPRSDDEPPSRGRPAPHAPRPDDEFAEWDSEATIAAVERALAPLGEVVRLEANADFPERLRATHPDIVFNMAEGLRGVNRESHVPAICEFFGIPYTGSDPFTLSLCLDKARTKECLAFHGVPTAPFALVRSVEELRDSGTAREAGGCPQAGGWKREATGSSSEPLSSEAVPLPASRRPLPSAAGRVPLPAFVKPVHEGSSKGITEKNLCRTSEELRAQVAELLDRYAQPVLVEAYLSGAEFTCAVLGNGAETRVLPVVGMNFGALPPGALPVYGYEAKWLWDTPEHPLEIFECPARIDEALRSRIEEVVLRAYRVLACRDWSRIDVRLDAAGVPNVVEVNPLPGILPNPEDNSCFPKAARAAGMGYDELVQACVRIAAKRQGVALPGEAVSYRPWAICPDDRRRAAALG